MSAKKPEVMGDKEPTQVLREILIKSEDAENNPFEAQVIAEHHLDEYSEALKHYLEEVLKNEAKYQSEALESILRETESAKVTQPVLDQKVQILVERRISDELYDVIRKEIGLKQKDKGRNWLVFVGNTFCFTGHLKKNWKYIGYKTRHFNVFIILL